MAAKKQENYRFRYAMYSESFKQDRACKSMRRKLKDMDVTGIYFDLILEALKPHHEKAPDPNEIVIEYFHEEDTLAEELALQLDRDAEQMQRFIDAALKYGVLQQRQDNPDLYVVYFPDETVGSITASSLRSRECRDRQKREVLQCNSEATDGNTYAANIKEKDKESKSNSDIHIDSNSDINMDSDRENKNKKALSALSDDGGASAAATLTGGGTPAHRPNLFTFADVQEQAERRKKDKLSVPEVAKMYEDFVSNGFKRCLDFMEKGEEKTAALFHAVNSWAKEHHQKQEEEPTKEPEELEEPEEQEDDTAYDPNDF